MRALCSRYRDTAVQDGAVPICMDGASYSHIMCEHETLLLYTVLKLKGC